MKHTFLFLALALPAFAQGPLTPPGSPAPTMKSLQEIWDKIGILETENAALKSEVALVRRETVTGLFALMDNAGIPLPWHTTPIPGFPGANLGGTGALNPITKLPAVAFYDGASIHLREFDGT